MGTNNMESKMDETGFRDYSNAPVSQEDAIKT